MPCRATQDGQVIVESSDKTWSIGGGMANHSSILAVRTPLTVRKGRKRYWIGVYYFQVSISMDRLDNE